MAMVKVEKELETKLVRYEILLDKWCYEHKAALIWADRFIERPKMKSLMWTLMALLRRTVYHIKLFWMIRKNPDVAEYNHHRVEMMNA